MEKEKLQRFSIRKLSIGAVSCLIGTVSFLSYSYKVQAAETPQTIETAKAENEIQPEKAQESKPSKEVKGGTQNAVVDKNTVGSQETGAVTTVNQTGSKENAPVANEAAKANEAAVINKAETNKFNGTRNETDSVDTTVFKTNTASKEAKENIAGLALSTKMKLQAIRLAKPVQTVSPEQSADTTDVQPASGQVESAVVNSNAPENDVNAASASTVLSKQPANTDTQPTATTSGVQPFVNLAVASDNNELAPKRETVDSTWTLHYVNQADHKQELKDPTVITMQYERTSTPQSDGTTEYGDWSYVPGSFKQTGTPITVKDSDNPVKQDNIDKDGENFDVFTITAMYPTVAGYGFYNGINGTRLHDNLRNNERQADAMSKDFYAEYDVAKPTQETVTSQWTIHYVNSTDHKQELKDPTVITMQYTRTNTPQSDGTTKYGDWSYVPGSFKQTGTLVEVNGSDNPVKEDNIDNNGKNEDVFSIIVKHPTITGYEFHNGINGVRLSDHLLNNESNDEIQAPTMSKDGYVEYDVAKERSVAVKFVDDQSYDFNTSDHKKQIGQAVTVTGRDGDTVNLKLTVPDKYQLADGQQLPTTYTFAKGSGDLKIHLVHQVVQREATIDVRLGIVTSVHTSDDAYAVGTLTQARWKQLADKIKDSVPNPAALVEVLPSVEVGTLTGHADYDLVDERVTSLGDDWTTLNLGGKTYQLPNGDEVVNGIMIDSNTTWGKSFKEENLKSAQIEHVDLDPDYVNRPWHGYLSVNATNNDNNGFIDEVHSLGLQAGLVGDEPNALAKAIGDRAATSVKMSNKNIDLNLLQGYDFDFSEQDGQLRANAVLLVSGVYVPYVEKTATRTINVTTPDGKITTVKQTATLAKQVGYGEDVHLDWTTGEWANYTVPTITGYTASQSNVAKEAVTGTTEDQTVNITYTANDGTQTIVYQDEDGSEVGKQVVPGKTDETVKVTPDVPDGYVLKGEVPSEVTIKPDDNPITVTVEHGKSHVTPDKPVNKGDLIPDTKDKHYPEGLTHNDLNKTVTRTVSITDPSGKKTTRKQTVTFTRDATVDEVTGKVTYGTWSENGKHIFDEVNVPYITGYRASEEVPEVTVIPDSESTKVNVTYVAKTYDVYIFYQKVSTIYDSDGSDAIFYRKDFDKYANGKLGIAKPEVLRGHYGESINIPIKQVQGYHVDPYRNYSNYKFGMDAITGQELSWYDFDFNNSKDLKDPLPEDASEDEKENSMPRFIFVDYIKDYANSVYNNSGYNIGYVDTKGAVIGRPTNLRGISGTDTNFTAPTFEGYTLTNPQEVPEKFDKTSKDIFLVYKPQDVKVTYHYVDETGKELAPSVAENNHFTGLIDVDKHAKQIDGYRLVSTPKECVVEGLKDLDLSFVYAAKDGTQTISYQDNGQEVGKQVITGKTDQTVKVTPEVPDGYVVKSEIPKEVTIKAKDETIVIAVEHGKAYISSDKPVEKGDLIPGTKDKHYPEGLTHDDLNKTVIREITITDPTGKKSTTTQTVTFTRGATVDEVTNEVTYGTWSENGKHTFDKVEVPYIAGYRASGEVPSIVVTPEIQSSNVDITYIADAQHMTITYVDDTTGKTLKQDKLDGTSDQDTKYTTVDSIKQYTDLHYKLVSDSTNGKDLIFDHDDNKDQAFEVHFVHDTRDISDKRTITETITYTMSDGSTAPNKVEKQVEFNRVGKHDDVTGSDTWDEWQPNKQSFNAVTTPEVTGYTPDVKSVETKTVTAGDKDISETITYTPDKQKAKVVFIDDTTKTTLDTHNLTGVTNGHESYSPSEEINQFVNKHYVLVPSDNPEKDYPEKGFTYDNDDGKDQVFEVHFKHATHDISDKKTITETITYTMSDGSKAPDKVEKQIEFNRVGKHDDVTGTDTWSDWQPNEQSFSTVPAPEVKGYTPTTKSVEAQTVTAGDKDTTITITITYTPNKQKAKVVFIDDTTKKVLDTHDLTGVTNSHEDYDPSKEIDEFVNKHYVLVPSDNPEKDYPEKGFTYDNDDGKDQVFEIHFVHGTHDISDKKSITETIIYTMSDGSKAPNKVERQIEFNRIGKHDDVTGTDTWDEWQPNEQSFSTVPTPEVKGYTPTTKSVEAQTVTAGDKDTTITITITYTPNKQKAKVVFIDDTTKKVLDTHDLTGVTNGHEKYNPSEEIEKFIHDNYVFVSSDYPEKGFTYDNDDSEDQVFEVHLRERPTDSDTPTVPNNTEDNGGSNDTPTVSDEPEKDNGGSDTVDKSGHKTPVKRNSNKKHHGTKKINNQKNANKKHQGTNKTNNPKTSKTAKLNPNEVDRKANKLTQTKLGKVQESTNDTLPQTGEKQSGLMAALGLAISSLGMIGAIKSKKRKDNE